MTICIYIPESPVSAPRRRARALSRGGPFASPLGKRGLVEVLMRASAT